MYPAGAGAAECSNAEFRTGASADLPDCRAYEQVSTQRKFGNGVWANPLEAIIAATGASLSQPAWTSPGGNRLLFAAVGGAGAENARRGFQLPQTAERGAEGWAVRPTIDGPADVHPLLSTNVLPRHMIPSVDAQAMLFTGYQPFSELQPPSLGAQTSGAVHAVDQSGAISWLSQPSWAGADLPPGANGVSGAKFVPIAISDDQSTAYFMTRQTLTPQDGASGRTWDQAWALYKVKDGVLSNAGVLPDGTIDPAGSMSAGMDMGVTFVQANHSEFTPTLGNVNVVSPDGRRALFLGLGNRTVPGRVPQLYLHRDGQPSLLISKSPAASTPVVGSTGIVPLFVYTSANQEVQGAVAATLASATGDRDLGVIVFATRDALLPGNPSDGTRVNTYRYDVGSNTLEYLADLDRPGAGPVPVPANDSRGRRGNVYRVSGDAKRILFWTEAGELKLWRHGASTLTLATGLEGAGGTISTRGVRFSEDGRTVVFMSTRALGGELNHPPGNGYSQTQVYRYEEGVDAAPRCVSCPPGGSSSAGPAVFDFRQAFQSGFGQTATGAWVAAQNRGISADGRRVFFSTTTVLSNRDLNATADVYEWSPETGPMLLSSGAVDSRGDALLDNDASGDNVFFVSEQQLTASDTDDIFDVYVARANGGLPDPPGFDPETKCSSGSCQGDGAPRGPLAESGSSILGPVAAGPADLGIPGTPRFAVRRSRASSTKATVGVDVPGGGTIRVTGNGVRAVTRRVSRAGGYTVHARLTAEAQRRVARSGRAAIRLRVRFTPSSGEAQSTTVRVTAKRSVKSNRKAVR